MKKLNLHFKVILLISVLLISSKNIYSQWTITGDLAGLTGPRSTCSVVDENTAFVTGGVTINATYKTTNGGTNWIQLNTSAYRPFWSIFAKDANTVFAGDDGSGNRINFYKTTNGGDNWTLIDSISGPIVVFGAGSRQIRFSNSIPSFGIAYASVNNQDFYIYKTRDGGNTWTRSLIPGYPGFGITGGLNVIDSLFYGFGAFGAPPSIILTTDGGATWNLRSVNLPSGNNNSVRGLAFRDKLTGIAGSSSTRNISRTTDGGLNWVTINFGSNITNSFIGPVMKWAEGTPTCYLTAMNDSTGVQNGVFKSTDEGLNWTEMETSGLGVRDMDTKRIGLNVYGYAIQSVPGATSGGNQVLKLIDDEALPVELSSFVSIVIDRNVKLNWTTSMESNNSGFEIERSIVNSEWSIVNFVTGHGNSNVQQNYSYEDRNLSSGRYKYRLKQIDYNGNFEYYNLQNEVVIGVPDKYSLSQNYPNPFNPTTKINYELRITNYVSLKVYDVLGNEVFVLVDEKQNAGYYTIDFDGGNFSSGVYFYKLEVDGSVIDTKRMVLMK